MLEQVGLSSMACSHSMEFFVSCSLDVDLLQSSQLVENPEDGGGGTGGTGLWSKKKTWHTFYRKSIHLYQRVVWQQTSMTHTRTGCDLAQS